MGQDKRQLPPLSAYSIFELTHDLKNPKPSYFKFVVLLKWSNFCHRYLCREYEVGSPLLVLLFPSIYNVGFAHRPNSCAGEMPFVR